MTVQPEPAAVSRLAVVLVVCLVAMAGCSGLSGGDGPPDREPYGVDERVNVSVEEGPEELLPGLTTDGVTNVSALREAHREAIGNRSYAIEYEDEYVMEENNETVRQSSNVTIYIDPEAEVVHEVVHQRYEGNRSIVDQQAGLGPNRTVERWFGEGPVSRTEFENDSVEYTTWDEGTWTPATRIEQTSTQTLAPLQNVEETRTAGAVESEEGTYYVVEGEENGTVEDVESGQQEYEMEARTLIREDGLLRQTVSERVHVHQEEERTLINRTTEITAIGETDVERPDWYEEAVTSGAGEPEPENPPDGESDGNETPADDAEPDGAEGEE